MTARSDPRPDEPASPADPEEVDPDTATDPGGSPVENPSG